MPRARGGGRGEELSEPLQGMEGGMVGVAGGVLSAYVTACCLSLVTVETMSASQGSLATQ